MGRKNLSSNYILSACSLIVLFFLSVLIPGCQEVKPELEQFVIIGVLMPTLQEERWHRESNAIIDRANEFGVAVKYLYSESNPDLQSMQMENLIAQKVDIIIAAPCDTYKLAPMVGKAKKAGIKVISYDRLIHDADIDMYITFQNEMVGEIMTKAILKQVPKGKIALIGGSPTDSNAVVIRDAALSILQPKIDSGEIELVLDEYTSNWEPSIAYDTMRKYLMASDADIDGVICANDGMASGVIKALKEFGLAGKTPVSGQDAELMACKRLLQGTQLVTVYKPIDELAIVAADVAIAMVKGESSLSGGEVFTSNGKKMVPTRFIPVIEVNRENMMDTVIKDAFHTYDEVYKN